MSIMQINIWTCEVCSIKMATMEETAPFSDPIVGYPTAEKWGYIGPEDRLACPTCLLWEKQKS